MSEKKEKADNEENIIEVLKQIFKSQDEKFQLLEQHLTRISEQLNQLMTQTHSSTYTRISSTERPSTGVSVLEPIKSMVTSGPEFTSSTYHPTARTKLSHNVANADIPMTSTPPPPPVPSKPEVVLPTIRSTAGMVETPLILAEESFKTDSIVDEFTAYRKEKARMESDTIKNYLTKIGKVTEEKWSETKKVFVKKDYVTFLNLALSVLHGIIEYYYVNIRHEIPDNIGDYITKAQNISSANVFKDVNLLSKMESVYNELENGQKPMLTPVVMNGWYERLNRIIQEWQTKRKSA